MQTMQIFTTKTQNVMIYKLCKIHDECTWCTNYFIQCWCVFSTSTIKKPHLLRYPSSTQSYTNTSTSMYKTVVKLSNKSTKQEITTISKYDINIYIFMYSEYDDYNDYYNEHFNS